MAVQSIYLRNASSNAFQQLQVDGSPPATANTGIGWIVGTTAPTAYSQYAKNTERAASTFSATVQPPDSGPDATLGDGFRTSAVLNGRYAAGTWTIAFPVIRDTAGTTTDGRVRIRLWRSPNTDGSAATEITAGTQLGTAVTNLTNVQQISTVTAVLEEFGVVDEYLFLSVAWEITGAGGGATDDVIFREGSAAAITTTDFVVATGTEYWAVLAGQGLVFNKGDYVRTLAQQFAAQVATESAGVRLGESALSVPNWAGGSGYPNFDPAVPNRYYQGLGIDVTTTKDRAQVGPGLTASLSSARNAQRVFGIYNGELYVGSSTGQVARQTATDTWTDPVGTITSNRPVSAIAEAGHDIDGVSARMWIANGLTGGVASWNGTTFTNNDADFDVGALALDPVTLLLSWEVPEPNTGLSFVAGGTMTGVNRAVCSVVKDTAFGGNWPYIAANGDQSDVGYPIPTAALVAADGDFYWCASDTVALKGQVIKSTYAPNPSNNVQFSGEQTTIAYLPDDYLTGIVELGGVMYGIGVAGRLYIIEVDKLTLVSSGISPSSSELHGLVAWNNALWVPCRSGSSLLVRRYGAADPAAATEFVWSEPIYGGTIDASTTAARQAIAFGGDLYVATEAAGASKVYRMRAGAYNTSPVTLQPGEITFDSAVIIKSVKLEHSALVASDSVQLKYSRNGSATFNSLGTNSTVGSTSSRYDVAASGQVTRLSVQAVITAGSSAATPQLGQLTIVVRPIGDVTREWTITVQMFGTASLPDKRKNGSSEPHTGQVVDDSLWAIFEEGVTQRFRDMDGRIYTVTVSDFSDHPQEELAHTANLRWAGSLTLREV